MIVPNETDQHNTERKKIMKKDELKLLKMSDIQVREVDWLWYPYIPFGKLTIIHGDPGEGKTTFARKKERQFAEYINRKNTAQLRRAINALQMEIDTARKRRNELAALFKRLYEDNVLGRVTNEQFRLLSADYNAEQKEIDDALPLKEERLEKLKSSAANVDAFIEKAKRYKTIDKLTPEIVRLFIARIEVGERTVKYSRHSAQKIRIIYRDIGEWDYDDAVEAEQQQPQVVAVTVAQPELLPA